MTIVGVRGICSLWVVLLAFLSGCTFTPHETVLHSTAVAATSDVGRGTNLYFKFVDERDDTVIGHHGTGGNGAKITSENLPSLVESSLRDGLTKKGYRLVAAEEDASASVTFRLRSFKFEIAMGFFTGEQNSVAPLSLSARGGLSP